MSKTSNGITDRWIDPEGRRTPRHGKGKRYLARYLGPDRREVSKVFERKGDAAYWLRDQRNQIDRAEWVSPARANVTVNEMKAEWWERKQPHLKPSTTSTYAALWANQIEPTFGAWPISQLRRRHIDQWIQGLTARGLSASRTRQAHVVLTMILEHAVNEERLPRNPSIGVSLPKLPHVDETGRTALTAEEIITLADAVARAQPDEQPQYRTFVLILAFTGMRFGEASALRVEDLDLFRRRVRISRSTTDVNGRMEVSTPKSGRSRIVAVPHGLVSELVTLCDGKEGKERLFTSPRNGVLRPSNFRRRYWRPAVTSMGMPGLVPHELRHSAAALAIASGATIKDIQNMLGHASAAMTLDRYGHLYSDAIDTLGEAMNRALLGATEPSASAAFG